MLFYSFILSQWKLSFLYKKKKTWLGAANVNIRNLIQVETGHCQTKEKLKIKGVFVLCKPFFFFAMSTFNWPLCGPPMYYLICLCSKLGASGVFISRRVFV